jgi:hypothetical protein
MRVTRCPDGTSVVEMPAGPTLRIGHVNPVAVVHSVQGSTAALDYPWLPELLAHGLPGLMARAAEGTGTAPRRMGYVDLLQSRMRQVESAANARLERSQRIRAAVRAEGGALPQHEAMHRRVAIVARRVGLRLADYGLRTVPSIRVIRRELRRLEKKDGPSDSERPADERTLPSLRSTEGE